MAKSSVWWRRGESRHWVTQVTQKTLKAYVAGQILKANRVETKNEPNIAYFAPPLDYSPLISKCGNVKKVRDCFHAGVLCALIL